MFWGEIEQESRNKTNSHRSGAYPSFIHVSVESIECFNVPVLQCGWASTVNFKLTATYISISPVIRPARPNRCKAVFFFNPPVKVVRALHPIVTMETRDNARVWGGDTEWVRLRPSLSATFQYVQQCVYITGEYTTVSHIKVCYSHYKRHTKMKI